MYFPFYHRIFIRLNQGSRVNKINTFYCFLKDFNSVCSEKIQWLLIQYGAFALIPHKAWAAVAIIAFPTPVCQQSKKDLTSQYCYENSLAFMYSLRGSQPTLYPQASKDHPPNHCYTILLPTNGSQFYQWWLHEITPSPSFLWQPHKYLGEKLSLPTLAKCLFNNSNNRLCSMNARSLILVTLLKVFLLQVW